MQKKFGELRCYSPVPGLAAGIETWNKIKEQGYEPAGKEFFEIGTGRVPLVPLAYWLMGAEKIITIDLNPYLKEELIRETLRFISVGNEEIRVLFGNLAEKKRLDSLLNFARNDEFSVRDFLDFCRIDYVAPCDAARTGLPAQCIDYYTSFTTLEHIPAEILKQILEESNRIINNHGLFIHGIDYSDHFSHSDKKISAINFLQYSDDEWNIYAGNKYMYMNRLRHDDFVNMFQSAGHRILKAEPNIDWQARELLRRSKLKLDRRFRNKSEDILLTSGSWIVSQKRD
jgi:hypothetical protein